MPRFMEKSAALADAPKKASSASVSRTSLIVAANKAIGSALLPDFTCQFGPKKESAITDHGESDCPPLGFSCPD
jgi:hypothetical protein